MTYFNIDGSPKHVACFARKIGEGMSRFTVVFLRKGGYAITEEGSGIANTGRVDWFDLPSSFRKKALETYCALWGMGEIAKQVVRVCLNGEQCVWTEKVLQSALKEEKRYG
jgi:hypothetical protein